MRQALQSHANVISRLISASKERFPIGELQPYFDQLVEQTREIWDLLEVQKETINALYETNASLIDFRINEIMKTQTIFSVIVFPLTLFAALFSMSTRDMSLVDHPHSFWIILSIMLLATTGMLAFFKKKKWI